MVGPMAPPVGSMYGQTSSIAPGSTSFDVAGNHNFIVPPHNSITFKLWGGGKNGTAVVFGNSSGGQNGGNTTITSLGLTARGATSKAGGTATGGDINTTGGAATICGVGGSSPNGGVGGQMMMSDAGFPGGGGAGYVITGEEPNCNTDLDGGAGGYCQKTLSSGVLTPGSSLALTVGVGGAAGGVTGFASRGGRIVIEWN